MLTKALGGVAAVLLLACVVLNLKYERAKAERDTARLAQASAESAMKQIEGLFDQQKEQLNHINNTIAKQQENVNEYMAKVGELTEQLGEARAEITQLRAGELNRAITAPFDRGNAAVNRLSLSVSRIGGKGDSAPSGGAANSNNAGTQ